MSRIRLLLLTSTLLIALWPHMTWAACSSIDVGACLDQVRYDAFHGLAAGIWSLDRALLVLAYQIDHIHWWLTTQAFLSAYTALRSVAEPLLAPLATLAILIGMLLFLLVPVFGRIELINIRQVFMGLIVAPLVLAQAGTWLLTLEETRADVGMVLSAQVSGIAAQGLFGPPSDDPNEPLPAPTPLYPEAGQPSPCPNAPVNRPLRIGTVAPADGLRTDDLAAALLLADAQDIHCPASRAPDRNLPDRFYADPGFAVNANDLARNPDAVARATAIANIQRGITRLALGGVACLLAVFDALIQCVFSLSLVVIWLVIPILLLGMLFSPSLRPVGVLLQRAASAIVTGWVVSVLLGMLTACLSGAAATGNPMAVIGITLAGVLFAARLLLVAVTTFSTNLSSMGDLVGGTAGMAVNQGIAAAATFAQRAVQTAGGLVSGGVGGVAGAVATAKTAHHATGSGRYALASVAGRIRPVAQLGAVAAGMGLIDEEVGSGLAAGATSVQKGVGRVAATMRKDAKRKLQDGTTIRQRAATRSAERQLHRAQQPTTLQRIEQATGVGGSDALGMGLHQTSTARAPGQVGDSPVVPTTDPFERLGAAATATVTSAATALRHRDLARRPESQAGMAVRQDPDSHRLVWLPRQTPPAHAETRDTAVTNRAHLLATGYTIQEGETPDTLTIWQDDPKFTPATRRAKRAQVQPNTAPRQPQIAITPTLPTQPSAAPTIDQATAATPSAVQPPVPSRRSAIRRNQGGV